MREVIFITEEFDATYDALEEYFEQCPDKVHVSIAVKEAFWYVDDIHVELTTKWHRVRGRRADSIFMDDNLLNDEEVLYVVRPSSRKPLKSVETAISCLNKFHYKELKER